ncbi:hypothetical protein BMS_2050 [Halobacteriovorax marinus SJ]|uniref:Uncharacterized protein n=2 Tax=Halobacteriovorax marinus TaxID=97084 RepID=E1X332_HALMS|nr:hypothetical protein BMS_2050 [Halobacteriovorax marinus SJ]
MLFLLTNFSVFWYVESSNKQGKYMKLLGLTSLLLLTSISSFAIECTGERRELIGTEVKVTKESLVHQNIPGLVKLTLDIDEAYYSVTQHDDSIIAMITLGPDYTNGNLFKGDFDSNGRMRLSSVSARKTYILECTK